MFGFSSLACTDCTNLDKEDKNRYGEAYCPNIRKYVSLDSTPCREFIPNFYIMTAYCKIKKLKYDCIEMTTLINLRDNYMMNTEEGKEFLNDYENIGPLIASRLLCDIYKTDVVNSLEETYIMPAIDFVNEKRYKEAQQTYIQMIEALKVRYGYSQVLDISKTKRL